MAMSGEAGDWNSPMVFYFWVDLYAGLKDGHLLDRPHDRDTATIETPHEVFVCCAPAGDSAASAGGKLIWETDEFVGEETSANESRVVVAEVAYSDRCAGAEVIVGFLREQPQSACVRVTLQVPSDPVISIAQSVGK